MFSGPKPIRERGKIGRRWAEMWGRIGIGTKIGKATKVGKTREMGKATKIGETTKMRKTKKLEKATKTGKMKKLGKTTKTRQLADREDKGDGKDGEVREVELDMEEDTEVETEKVWAGLRILTIPPSEQVDTIGIARLRNQAMYSILRTDSGLLPREPHSSCTDSPVGPPQFIGGEISGVLGILCLFTNGAMAGAIFRPSVAHRIDTIHPWNTGVVAILSPWPIVQLLHSPIITLLASLFGAAAMNTLAGLMASLILGHIVRFHWYLNVEGVSDQRRFPSLNEILRNSPKSELSQGTDSPEHRNLGPGPGRPNTLTTPFDFMRSLHRILMSKKPCERANASTTPGTLLRMLQPIETLIPITCAEGSPGVIVTELRTMGTEGLVWENKLGVLVVDPKLRSRRLSRVSAFAWQIIPAGTRVGWFANIFRLSLAYPLPPEYPSFLPHILPAPPHLFPLPPRWLGLGADVRDWIWLEDYCRREVPRRSSRRPREELWGVRRRRIVSLMGVEGKE
ncbi:hypothetical protein BD779DRAFT_1476973 [Infundibulicybe gibba]|nr:hypothetical protein BD779DRAFT_1476973 [Infundibulicybe gibba]